jgi:hypothetical protein
VPLEIETGALCHYFNFFIPYVPFHHLPLFMCRLLSGATRQWWLAKTCSSFSTPQSPPSLTQTRWEGRVPAARVGAVKCHGGHGHRPPTLQVYSLLRAGLVHKWDRCRPRVTAGTDAKDGAGRYSTTAFSASCSCHSPVASYSARTRSDTDVIVSGGGCLGPSSSRRSHTNATHLTCESGNNSEEFGGARTLAERVRHPHPERDAAACEPCDLDREH